MSIPDFLIDRYKDWKDNIFSNKNKFYQKLQKNGQSPKAMIITCCDSRINLEALFKIKEGECFIHRNIANLIPAKEDDKLNYETSAAIEYACSVLKIKNLIIIGHSDCGGIKHAHEIFSGKISNKKTFVDKWIKIIKPAYLKLKKNKKTISATKDLEKLSIQNSIKNLLSYPKIKKLVSNKELSIFGLWFEIKSGKIMYYNSKKDKFEKLI